MKKTLLILAILLGMYQASGQILPGDYTISDAEIQSYIDINIVPNASNAITATKMNALLSMLNYSKLNRDSIVVVTRSGDTLFFSNGGILDTLIIAASHWTLTGNDIENNNSGKTTIDSGLYLPHPDMSDTRIGYIMAWEHTTGNTFPTTLRHLYDTLQYNASLAPSIFDTWFRDNVKGALYQSDLTDKVGIGTDSPAEQLHLTKSMRLLTTTNDSVGIVYKDATPWLHDFHKTGTTGENIFLGGAGNLTLTGSTTGDQGSLNVGVGKLALSAATTGQGNTAIGWYAAPATTSGNYNTAIGMTAMQGNQTGGFNVAIGWEALKAPTNVSNLVAIGRETLNDNTSGYENTAVGSESLSKNTTGYRNTAIGYQAMRLSTVPYENVAIGNYSMGNANGALVNSNIAVGGGSLAQVQGACNNAIGVNALQSLELGHDNKAMGTTALGSLVTGNGNIGIGTYLGRNFTTGNYNIMLGDSVATVNSGADYNISIGYKSGYSLDGNRNIFLGAYAGYSETGSDKLYIENTTADSTGALIFGNFGINKVTVNGNFKLPVSSTATGIFYKGASPFLSDYYATGTSGSNTWLGVGAGNLTLTGSDSGDEGSYNTAVGYNTLNATTTGNQNTSLGALSGVAITTGASNTSAGAFSLYTNQTGAGNTALGYQALKLNTANYLTAIGYNALAANTTGVSNTAIGYNALSTNVGAKYNTAIGYSAMENGNSTASEDSYNTAIGFSALKGSATPANNTGTYNTAVGANSMITNTSGYFNNAIGVSAGGSNTTGHDNVYIGYGSGFSNQTGSGNIFLGSNAGSSETASNKLYIDNSNSATPLIHGDFNTNQLWLNGGVQVGGTEVSSAYTLFVDGSCNIATVLKLTPTASPPGSPEEGMIYMDTDHHLYVYNGTGWIQLDN